MQTNEIIGLENKYHMNLYNRIPLVLERGNGVYLYDNEGNCYLDFAAGIAVNSLGHNDPDVTKAIKDQAEKLIHGSNLYHYESQNKLAKILVGNSSADRVFFANSGAEANEAALKLTRRYFYNQNQPKHEIIVADRSFHGRTLATLAATDRPKYQKPFQPLPTGFKVVPFNDLKAAEDAITPETAAIMVEPVQGEGGVRPASQDYLTGLRKLADEKNILLIFDEVQTGIGRTGHFFAHQAYGVEPDIFTSAKALGNGVPISALLAKEKVAKSFQPGDHATTYGGNPLVCSAALATVNKIIQPDFLSSVRETGQYLKESLENLSEEVSWLGPVRGMGLLLAVKTGDKTKELMTALRKQGILVLTAGEDLLRFAPPLIIKKEEIDQFIKVFKSLVKDPAFNRINL
ncbi:aspartate aminotransferase family protein [Halanaerobiaceae bacterium Z-7014]|uniref:Acetylornithine aminotransferase n=1 Tax=Halonatronomonas betaini TaxID=2778430 RepID=A0A931AR24_9FIRM|nr:aspartate aminotransferase family protein [Halonatronomonas betaini]MBF8436266.1 aspartate aminotransferase family protein [Halonatronomonas betaini]